MANVIPVSLPKANPHNIQAVKRYVFNETGNIMLATTDSQTDNIQQEVRDVFAEVSVFFGAMTKAISQTVNPHAKPDKDGNKPYYNLYNYDALQSVIDGSGYFVRVNEEDISYTTSSWGANFSKELIEAVLGLATGGGALSFASAMVNSMGKEGVNINGQSSSLHSKVANVIFVCEYLLGMPIVSAIVITADSKTVSQTMQLGPCFKEQSSSTTMTVHKETFMFVTPAFIKQYAGDLSSIMNDPEYLKLIMELESLVERTPTIEGVYEVQTAGAPVLVPDGSMLKNATKYAIYGEFLGSNVSGKSSLAFDPATGLKVSTQTWNNNGIEFNVVNSGKAKVDNATLTVTLSNGKTIDAGVFSIEGPSK